MHLGSGTPVLSARREVRFAPPPPAAAKPLEFETNHDYDNNANWVEQVDVLGGRARHHV